MNAKTNATVIANPELDARRQAAIEEVAALRARREEAEKLLAAQEKLRALGEGARAAAADTDSMEFGFGNFELPSWKRVLCGFILGIVGAGFTGYGIGLVMSYALAGIATMAAGPAIALFLSVIVWILGIYSAWKVGGWVGGKIFASVVLPEGLASRSIASVSNAVSGVGDRVRSSSFSQRVHEFTGATVKAA